MAHGALEFRLVCPELERPLAEFFRDLSKVGDTKHFHPHEFTDAEAHKRACYVGNDLYYVAAAGDHLLAYGMLRGWDEGFANPSLGIALHPASRGTGLARAFMLFLHAAAKARGASKVRLKVYPDNVRAVRLYQSLGYTFEAQEAGQLVGILAIDDSVPT